MDNQRDAIDPRQGQIWGVAKKSWRDVREILRRKRQFKLCKLCVFVINVAIKKNILENNPSE